MSTSFLILPKISVSAAKIAWFIVSGKTNMMSAHAIAAYSAVEINSEFKIMYSEKGKSGPKLWKNWNAVSTGRSQAGGTMYVRP